MGRVKRFIYPHDRHQIGDSNIFDTVRVTDWYIDDTRHLTCHKERMNLLFANSSEVDSRLPTDD